MREAKVDDLDSVADRPPPLEPSLVGHPAESGLEGKVRMCFGETVEFAQNRRPAERAANSERSGVICMEFRSSLVPRGKLAALSSRLR